MYKGNDMNSIEKIVTQMAYKSPNQDNFKVGAVLSDFIDDDNGIKYKLNSKHRVIKD